MNALKKIIAMILLTLLILITIYTTSKAISENITQNEIQQNITVDEIKEQEEKSNIVVTQNENIESQEENFSDNQNISEETKKEESDINNVSSNLDDSLTSNVFYDKISNKQINTILTNLNLSKNTITNGMWIENNSRTLINNFINGHTSYSYTINSNGFISCDNILRENNNLDLIEPAETEMDIALNNILNTQITIISTSKQYIEFNSDSYTLIDFNSNQYLKSYENQSIRVLILNSNFYNVDNNIEYNLDLSDSFIKALNNIQSKVLSGELEISKENTITRSSRNIKGTSIGHQTVWAGPKDNGSYATIGSVDDGEPVYILGKEDDYYHVQYVITSGTSSGKEKSGYILRSSLNVSVVDKVLIQEEKIIGGYRYANVKVNIESCDDIDISVNTNSSVSKDEGVTLLYDYGYSDWTGKSYRIAFIEYSTSNGIKRGYIKNDNLLNPFSSTLIKSPARIITYTGPNEDRFSVDTGAIGINEYVCAIGYNGSYVFLEYNTNNGRRRAFAKSSELNVDISKLNVINLPDIKYNSTYSSTEKQNVSAAPGECYTLAAYRGIVGKNEPVYEATSNNVVYNQLDYTYIVYHVASAYKGGYVKSSTLVKNVTPSFPDMPTYNEANGEFKKTYIGQTGLGQSLYSYRIGNGENKIYLCYNQHGWEDGKDSDGIELVLLAKRFMEFVNINKNNTGTSEQGNIVAIENINFVDLLKGWTIYVIPSINRDGITSGWTNIGPGRTDVTTKIDMNRNWDTNYYKAVMDINDGRNYTGPTIMATSSAQAVSTYLLSNDVKPIAGKKALLLDIHGWDGEIVAWDSESKKMGEDFFKPHFISSTDTLIGYTNGNTFRSREKETSTSAGGYIIRWAIEKLKATNSMIVNYL